MSNTKTLDVTIRVKIEDMADTYTKGKLDFISKKGDNIKYTVVNPDALEGHNIGYSAFNGLYITREKTSLDGNKLDAATADYIKELERKLAQVSGNAPAIVTEPVQATAMPMLNDIPVLAPVEPAKSKYVELFEARGWNNEMDNFFRQVLAMPQFNDKRAAREYINTQLANANHAKLNVAEFNAVYAELTN